MLHHIRQGALLLAGCLHAVGYFLCSEPQLVAIFAVNKTQTWHASYECFCFQFYFTENSKVSFKGAISIFDN